LRLLAVMGLAKLKNSWVMLCRGGGRQGTDRKRHNGRVICGSEKVKRLNLQPCMLLAI
jgi:hypothetical protein